MKEVYFTIKCMKKNRCTEIEFKVEMDEMGISDGYSFNPTTGFPTGFTRFTDGWSEQDEIINEHHRAIKDYVTSMECDLLLSEIEMKDIGREIVVDYFCNGYVHQNGKYKFIVKIQDVIYWDE